MKVKDILSQDTVSVSFEVFPPKKIESFDSVKSATEAIAQLHPDFMSVTYGAAGTTAGFTIEIAENLINEGKISVVELISHRVNPTAEELLSAYDGLMNEKNKYTGVIIKWKEEK